MVLTEPPVLPPSVASLAFLKDAEAHPDISAENIDTAVSFSTLRGSSLDSLLRFTQLVAAPPLLRAHSRLDSESLAKDFGHGLHRGLASLTEHAHRAHARTVLYVPVGEDVSDPAAVARDKAAIPRLEAVVTHWTRQIRDILAEKDVMTGQKSADDGPLAEINFWRRRAADLVSIVRQLQRPEVLQIVAALEAAKADYSVEPFKRLAADIEHGGVEALDNLKFLSTLEEAYIELAAAPVPQIGPLLRPLAARVMVIFACSGFYNTPDRLVGLLRGISREIVARASATIDVAAIWDGRVAGPMAAIEDAVALCDVWRGTCTQLLEACVARWEAASGKVWHADAAAVFAELDAFAMQRSKELLEICGGQLQFRAAVNSVVASAAAEAAAAGAGAAGSAGGDTHRSGDEPESPRGGSTPDAPETRTLVFGGAKGPELSRTLREMNATFERLLGALWQHRALILDVKASRWHDEFQVFRAGLKDLEGVMANAISSAFETVPNVTAGAELIDAFDGLAKRASLRRALAAKTRDVFAVYLRDVNAVKAAFNDNRRNPPVPMHHAPFAGRAAWALGLRAQLDRLGDALVFAGTMDDCAEQREGAATHALVQQRLEQYVAQAFEEWRSALPPAPELLLEQHVVGRSTGADGVALLHVNFPTQLQVLIVEARQWRHLGHTVPPSVAALVDGADRLLALKANVALAVRDYNGIITALTPQERRLFAERVGTLDRRAAPGLQKVTWASKGVSELYVRPLRKDCATVRDVVDAFHAAVATIAKACAVISGTALVVLERKATYSEAMFEQRQRQHRDYARTVLQDAHGEIARTMHSLYKAFAGDGAAIAAEWELLVQRVELDVDGALRQTVKRSLQELMRAVVDVRVDTPPLFVVEVVLDGFRPELRPSILQLSQTISTISRDLIAVVGVVPRLPDALVALDAAEADRADHAPPSAVAPAAGTDAAAQRAVRLGRGVEEQQDRMPFSEVMSNDNEVIRVMAAITEGMAAVQDEVQEFLARFDRYHELHSLDRAMWMRRFQNRGALLDSLEAEIKRYRTRMQDVANEETTATKRFVKLDCTRLKHALIEHCHEWQRALFGLLNTAARTELDALHTYFATTTAALRATPTTLAQLADVMAVATQVQAAHDATVARFDPLKAQYALLDRYEQTIPDAELEKLTSLPATWEAFEGTAKDARRRLERVKDTFRQDLEASAKTFERAATVLADEFVAADPYSSRHTVAEATALIAAFRDRIDAQRTKEAELRSGLSLFNVSKNASTEVAELEAQIATLERVWALHAEWATLMTGWTTEPFRTLDVVALSDAVGRFTRALGKLSKKLGTKEVFAALKEDVDRFRRTLPLLQQLLNPAMRDRHWQRLKDELALPRFDHAADTFVMGDITGLALDAYPDFVANLSSSASAELQIEKAITTIRDHWDGATLTIEPYRNDLLRLVGTDDLFAQLEEHAVQLSGFKLSRFVEPFEHDVTRWEHTLSLVADVVETFLAVQVRWLYLEAIFVGSDEIQKQLQQETALFAAANATWSSIVGRVATDPSVLRQCRKEGLLDVLQDLIRKFEKIQKLLEDYLETRRRAFPRFYFLSNDDVLEILGHAREPARVQPHLKKCFEGLTRLEIKAERAPGSVAREGTLHAVRFFGGDGESLAFPQNVLVEGVAVEAWLGRVEEMMRLSMRQGLLRAYDALRKKKPVDQWLRGHCGQLLVTASQLHWTAETERALVELHRSSVPGPDGRVAPALRRSPLRAVAKRWRTAVQQYCALIRSSALGRMERAKLVALITIQVHSRDILDQLVTEKVASPDAFQWVSQLRFYSQASAAPAAAGAPHGALDLTAGGVGGSAGVPGDCIVKQTSAEIAYDFEYIGNSGRLVVTPLTDRCYMTLTTALQLSRGGQPQGPAGTGKTETVKDLGKAIGKYVIVFNCSEGLDYESLGRMFAGLCQSGAWSCFDEFNRIEVEVLSVVAQQIFTILSAIFMKKKSFVFESRGEIPLQPGCGIFVTMNPGYAGRSELPDNLKALLRPVSMMVPDNALICEIILLSQGFSHSTSLARKVALLYALMEQQLSKQSHYDFGLRAIKSVLVRAGNLKRVAFQRAAATHAAGLTPQQLADEEANTESVLGIALNELQSQPVEEVLIWKACSDMNMPRFVADDVPLFLYMLRDLFPTVEQPAEETLAQTLRGALEAELVSQGLRPTPHVLSKGVQLFETKRTRHGVMVVGETLTAKTVTWKAVAGAMRRLGAERDAPIAAAIAAAGAAAAAAAPASKKVAAAAAASAAAAAAAAAKPPSEDDGVFENVRPYVINPKAVTNDELYGIYNLQTREWKDGIFSSAMRTICALETPDQKWVVFDGPVDTLWVESMNTVLDDNKLLTLNSGERIALPPQVSLLFECADLVQASPATVSRCGMVYFAASDLGWAPYLESWLQRRLETERAYNAPEPAETINMLRGLFEAIIPRALAVRSKECVEAFPQTALHCVRSLCEFIDALATPDTSGLGSFCSGVHPFDADGYRQTLQMYTLFALTWAVGGTVAAESRRRFDVLVRELDPTIPTADTVYEYFVDAKARQWRHFESHLGAWRPEPGVPLYGAIVPTTDTVRYSALLTILLRDKRHVLLTGDSGTGKTVALERALAALDDHHTVFTTIFSARTSSRKVQEALEGRLERKSKKAYAPPAGRRLVAVIEDVNLPNRDTFGSQPPLELLRQWLDTGAWFDRDKQGRRQVSEVLLVGVMAHGRQQLPARFVSKFHALNLTFPSEATLRSIFGQLIGAALAPRDEFKGLAETIVASTLDIHGAVSRLMRPTPAKPHYFFTLRHLSAVFNGILRADPARVLEGREQLIVLWLHETQRVYGDRLSGKADTSAFRQLLMDKMSGAFAAKWSALLKDARNPIFVDFLGLTDRFDEDRSCREVGGGRDLKRALESSLEAYNAEPGVRPLSLVFFNDAIAHLCRIYQLIRAPRGHALLVGIGGSGRSSLARLATYIAGYTLFELEITKSYGLAEFHEDLKRLYLQCGKAQTPTVLLMGEQHLVGGDAFLEELNSLLGAGEVPNLFSSGEVAELREDLRADALSNGILHDTAENVYAFFLNRARDNMHVVLCLSPVGQQFRDRVRMFPSLVSATGVDWFGVWPQDALRDVAVREFEDTDLGNEDRTSKIVDALVAVHGSVVVAAGRMEKAVHRKAYVTPMHYIEFVRGYRRLLEAKRVEFGEHEAKLRGGLEKLSATKTQVQNMSIELEEQRKHLAQATEDCEALLNVMRHERRVADEKRMQVEADKAKIQREQEHAHQIAGEAQADLELAMPALREAEAALSTLQKRDVDEIRAYNTPPDLIKLVMCAVQVTLKRPSAWEDAKRSLGESNFLKTLMEYDREQMLTDALLNKMAVFVQNPKFDPNIIGGVSAAAKGLCLWVIAMHRFGLVNKEVMPKKLKQRRAMEELERKERALAHAMASLDAIVAKVKELEAQTDTKLAEKARHQQLAEQTEAKLRRAEILVGGLGSERERWTASIEQFQQSAVALLGDAVIASAFVSYLGPFTSQFRSELLRQWTAALSRGAVPMTANANPLMLLVEPTVLREWQQNGLPGDDFSADNGVLVMKGERWPLMIDPQGQANRWIKSMEASKGGRAGPALRVIDARSPSSEYMRIIESALVGGHCVLMQDVTEELDPSLEPVLSRAVVNVGNRLVIKLGDTPIDFNPEFRLYLTTKLSNPHYTPEVCSKVTVVNFAVKEQGLEEQLLKLVVRHEKPELEEAKDLLVVSVSEARRATKELEDRILRLLASADERLLDDPDLLATLQTSKVNAQKIATQLKDDEATDEKISLAREQYRSAAHRASVLYFVLCDLAEMDGMYRFSLDAYFVLFQNSIANSSDNVRADSVATRVKALNDWHTLAVYNNTCRALFERHKLTFAFHMATRIVAGDGGISPDEFAFFVRGGASVPPDALPPNPCAGWLPPRGWEAIFELDRLPAFHGLAAAFEAAPAEWRGIFVDPTPEDMALPGEWAARLDPFQHSVLIRCLRPDRVLPLARGFVERQLGRRYTVPPALNLDDVLADSVATLPIIFILSPGVDPTAQLQQLAARHERALFSMALGQGQGAAALKLIAEQLRAGGWVFLANCHLMSSWLGQLEKVLDSLPSQRPAETFRLWLSSAPLESFPISILQKSMKITTEPPRGIRANMLRLYNLVREDTFTACGHPTYYRTLMWGITFFHSVLLERRKFGTLGLNVPYDFNDSDFAVSEQLLRIYLDELPDDARPDQVPFGTLRYLIADATYGGRVTEEFDRRLILTYIEDVCCEAALREEDAFQFAGGTDAYNIPSVDGPLSVYREAAAALPTSDPPEAFGQHPNADVASQIQQSNELLHAVMGLNAEVLAAAAAAAARRDGLADDAFGAASAKKKADDADAAVGSTEARVLDLVRDLVGRLPAPLDYAAMVDAKAEEADSALTTVLLQETLRYNALLGAVAQQLEHLTLGIEGLLVMDARLDAAFTAISNGVVPASWTVAYPSMKPLASWARDLVERVEQISAWGLGQAPRVFWLGGFTYPTGFLKALQQQAARRSGLAIDQFVWMHHVHSREDRTITAALPDGHGALVRGLMLEGAGWADETTSLCDPAPMELLVPMPIVHFEPVDAAVAKRTGSTYSCPLYLYPIRTGTRERPSFVTTVELSSGAADPSRWVKRGTALLLATDQ